VGSLFDDDEPKGVRDLFKVARDTIGNLQPLPAIFRLPNALDGVAVKAAIAHGWLTMHPSGAYLMFTQAGADLFA
jgi:hypothetical protein